MKNNAGVKDDSHIHCYSTDVRNALCRGVQCVFFNNFLFRAYSLGIKSFHKTFFSFLMCMLLSADCSGQSSHYFCDCEKMSGFVSDNFSGPEYSVSVDSSSLCVDVAVVSSDGGNVILKCLKDDSCIDLYPDMKFCSGEVVGNFMQDAIYTFLFGLSGIISASFIAFVFLSGW